MIYIIKSRQEAGVKVTVITTEPESAVYGNADVLDGLIDMMKKAGIDVFVKAEIDERFAIIDDELVWHGGMNLLGKEDIWDNLMRIKNRKVAAELLELAYDTNS